MEMKSVLQARHHNPKIMISRAEYRGVTEPPIENIIVVPGSIDSLSRYPVLQHQCSRCELVRRWNDVFAPIPG